MNFQSTHPTPFINTIQPTQYQYLHRDVFQKSPRKYINPNLSIEFDLRMSVPTGSSVPIFSVWVLLVVAVRLGELMCCQPTFNLAYLSLSYRRPPSRLYRALLLLFRI